MTLREIDKCLRDDGDDPMDRLVAALALLRSISQLEVATSEGIAASVNEFRRQYGDVTHANVDRFMQMPPGVLDTDIPNEYVLEVLDAD